MSKASAKKSLNTTNSLEGQANSLESTLTPIYTAMAQGKPTPATTAARTAAGQAAGGAESSALGQLNLQAARTRNAAGFAPAADLAARDAAHNLSNTDAGITAQAAREGLAGLSGLYGTTADNALRALGVYNDASNQTFGNRFGNALGSALGTSLGNMTASFGGGKPASFGI